MPRAKHPKTKGGRGGSSSSKLDEADSDYKFHQLPDCLVKEILSRLSLKTVLRCRYVCKPCLVASSDSDFSRLHLHRSISHSGSATSILVKTGRSSSWKLDYYRIEQGGFAARDLQIENMRFSAQNRRLPNVVESNGYKLRNSCNGLVCLSGDAAIYLCNPILGEYIIVPPSHTFVGCRGLVALGFANNEYKLLQTEGTRDGSHEMVIYTLGTRVWRSIGNAHLGYLDEPIDSLVHGALHWISRDIGSKTYSVQSFNFEMERFQSLPLPAEESLKFHNRNYKTLGVLQGCLFLCLFHDNSCNFDLWVMRDYGVQESWTKLLVFSPPANISMNGDYDPIMFLRDGEILLVQNQQALVRYNPAQNTLTKTKILRTRSVIDAIAYTPTLFSLNDISNGEEVKRVRENL